MKNSGNNGSGSQRVQSHDTPEEAAEALTDLLLKESKEHIEKKGRCVWAVSGGSSIHKIYDELLRRSGEWDQLKDNLLVTWVDERHVPHSSEFSNFGNADRAFWRLVGGVELLNVPHLETAKESARKYAEILEEKGIGRGDIDIIILGMGTDGHVASLFPNSEALQVKEANIVENYYKGVEHTRITMTYPMINLSERIFLYFYGSDKADVFKKAMKSGNLKDYPVNGIDMEKLRIFTDQVLK